MDSNWLQQWRRPSSLVWCIVSLMSSHSWLFLLISYAFFYYIILLLFNVPSLFPCKTFKIIFVLRLILPCEGHSGWNSFLSLTRLVLQGFKYTWVITFNWRNGHYKQAIKGRKQTYHWARLDNKITTPGFHRRQLLHEAVGHVHLHEHGVATATEDCHRFAG